MTDNNNSEIERDDVSGQETTGHEWDGIKELNTPMPRWWLWTFYVTIVWAVIYMVFYPAVPFMGDKGFSKGLLGHSDRDNVAIELLASREAQSAYFTRIDGAGLGDIIEDEDLFAFAYEGGRASFGDNCAPCHGSSAEGFKGFPNLLDDDWLWGGTLEDIYFTIEHGIRWEEDADTRYSAMPKFLDDEILDRDGVLDVVEYVLSFSGGEEDRDRAASGAVIYEEQCSACHGADGSGDRSQGAPNLADAVWLYGGDRESLFETVAHARFGVMPAWAGRLSAREMKQLSVYVHSLGGGEQTTETDSSSHSR